MFERWHFFNPQPSLFLFCLTSGQRVGKGAPHFGASRRSQPHRCPGTLTRSPLWDDKILLLPLPTFTPSWIHTHTSDSNPHTMGIVLAIPFEVPSPTARSMMPIVSPHCSSPLFVINTSSPLAASSASRVLVTSLSWVLCASSPWSPLQPWLPHGKGKGGGLIYNS